ncbi:MAG: hypothetical protein MJ010_00185 [Paludibacteraceae bacterium]|nr:hypothetical protein [Paludibacteraceae bacterium]
MKKILSVISTLLIVSNVSFAFNYWWGNALFDMSSYMEKMPVVSNSCITIEKQLITNGKLDCTVSTELSWYNFFVRSAMIPNEVCGYWTVNEIKYERKVYYSLVSNNTYYEFSSLKKSGYIDVRSVSTPSSYTVVGGTYQACSIEFNDSIAADISKLSSNNEYKLKVEYSFLVEPVVDICGSGYDPTETKKYVKEQRVSIENANTGAQAKFKIFPSSTNSLINVNGSFNPMYNTGSGDVYLIYNNPDAVISVIADTINLPEKKCIVNGTKLIYNYGVGAYLASIGASNFPTNIGSISQWTGCGLIDKQCSKVCNGVTEPTIEFVNDNAKQKSFLKRRGYLKKEYCYRRRTNVLQRSIDSDMTNYDENTIENFSVSKAKDYRMSRIFHLRDLSNVDVYAKKGYGAGSIIKIQNSVIYSSYFSSENYSTYADFYALGYIYYGPTYDMDIASGAGVVSNILEFEVVNAATLPSISASEKLPKMTCVTDTLVKEGDFIHLKGAAIKCGNYSETLYNPDYMWEVSFNGTDWEPLDKKTFSNYIIDRNRLKFAVVIDPDKDVLLKSTILRNRTQAQFRQKVILRSFASDEFSSLYNYKIDDKYYISIIAKDYYTYIPTPILDKENLVFSPSTFPLEQRLCKGDELTKNKISFKLKNSTNVSSDNIEQLSEIAEYKIYELHGDTVGKLVSNTNSYTMSFSGKTIGYRCVISWCTDSIYKDVSVIANEDEVIELNDVTSNVVIAERSETENKVKLLCQRGVAPTISLIEKGNKVFDYLYRSVVSYQQPSVSVTDFSSMSRTKIISFMKNANWDYAAETGTDVDNAGIDALRAWCRVKEDAVNAQIVSNAKNKYISENAWYGFSDSNTTVLPYSNSDASNLNFYIMKQNTKTKCFSDSVKIEIVFFDGIEDNKIAFSAAADASKSEVYVMENANSPSIKGYVIKGGYGIPSLSNDYKYIYHYIYREAGGVWQQLTSDVEVSGNDNKNVSLKAGSLKMDRLYQVARIVYSRVGNDISTQVSDTSNILTINVIEELKVDDVEVYNNGSCAGTVVTLGVPKYDPAKNIKDATRFIWTATDTAVKVISYDEMEKYCSLYNTRASFDVHVYREDTITGAKTKTVVIPIEVINVKPYFSITADGITRNILDYPNENFSFQSGTRFVLNNNSENADNYLWNLELQYFTGSEVEGLTSYIENPVCYLYNPGQNKIRLTAKNLLGCESQVTAENIYIQSSSVKSATMSSHFEDRDFIPQVSDGFAVGFEVYPTITKGEDVNIYYSKGMFHYAIVNSIGQVMMMNTSDNFDIISYENIPDGVSSLVLEAEDNGNMISKTVRLIKQ